MASTYTSELRIEKIATGEQSGTWGTTTNTQYDLFEAAISGTATVGFASDANDTLSTASGSDDEARHMFVDLTGGATLTATREMVVPTSSKLYFVRNNTTGGQSVTIKTSAGSGITVGNGEYMCLYCDGTNVIDAFDAVNISRATITGGSITGLSSAIPVASGGTGATTLTDGGVLLGSGTGAITATSVLADGEMIVGDGTTDPAIESGATLRTSIGVGTGDSPQFTGIELGHASDTTLSRSAAGALAVEGTVVGLTGKHAVPIPATGMYTATTNGAAAGATETSTNAVMIKTWDFDTATDEYVQFQIPMPKSWNESTITAKFYWSHASTTTNFGVSWGIQATAFGDSDALDASWGTGVVVDDTGGTTDDMFVTAESSSITIGGSPASEDIVIFRVYRDVSDTNDTMAIDARLHGVTLYFTTDAGNDA
jgi:hypothetical protein